MPLFFYLDFGIFLKMRWLEFVFIYKDVYGKIIMIALKWQWISYLNFEGQRSLLFRTVTNFVKVIINLFIKDLDKW